MLDSLHQHAAENTGGIVRWSIRHPQTVIVVYLGLFIAALLAVWFYLPRRMMPYVESPMVAIVTSMPGLSAEEMEIYFSKPIEEQLVHVKGSRYIRSSSQESLSVVSLEFPYGTNMQKAVIEIQSLMNVIQASLPMTGANLKPSWVIPIDPLNTPILSLHMEAPGWDEQRLREFADNQVLNRLKTVNGVYSVVPFGGYKRQLQVRVDRDKLASQGISILDVKKAVDGYNVSQTGGVLTQGPRETSIRIDTLTRSSRDLENIPLKGKDGAVVYLRDIAKVVDTHWEKRSGYFYSEGSVIRPGIEVSVYQSPEASSSQIVPKVNAELKKIEREYPGVKFSVAYDNAHFVNILFKNMFVELGIAILLTGLAVLFFLGNRRGALISLVTIPTSLGIAILGLVPFGMSLNSGTLIGLLLSIGRLVDDSIIDIHAIERYLKKGLSVRESTIKGISEVRLAVISTTVMLILALSPLLFCGGIVEAMFRELVWPIIMGLIASTFVSFTLTALLADRFLKLPDPNKPHTWFERTLMSPSQKALDHLDHAYGKAIQWVLKHRFSNLVRIIVTVIIGITFYNFIGSEMMPLADVGQAYGVLEMQPGTSFTETEKATQQILKIISKNPEIEKVSTEVGMESMYESFSPFFTGYAMPAVNAATFMFTLSDKNVRKKSIWDVMDGIQKEALATIPGIRRFQIKEMGSDVMATSAAPIQLMVYGTDLPILDKMGDEVFKAAQSTQGLYQPGTSWSLTKPSYKLSIDTRRAAELGLTPMEIAEQVYYATKGGLTDEYYRLPNIRHNTILVRYEENQRTSLNDLESVTITGMNGMTVPLGSIATIERSNTASLIEHDGLRRIKTITGFYRPGEAPSMDISMEVMMKAIEKLNFPPGYGIEMRGDMTQMMDSFNRLLLGLVIAMFLIYLVLVAQFKGFIQPFQMVASLPLELAGVFFALWLAGQHFSTVSIMAVIILTGMDATTSVLLLDMINKYRQEGMPRDEAVVKACPQRLRPILMTSMITIIVMVPLAFFPGTGMDAYSPLGTVIIGGLIIGTILSLFDVPLMHTYIDDLIQFFRQKRKGSSKYE